MLHYTPMPQEQSPLRLRNLPIMQIVHAIYSRRWLAMGLFITVFGVVAYFTFTQPDVYQASAKLLFKKERVDKIISPNDANVSMKPDIKEETLNSEIEIIKSGPLLRAVVQSLELDKQLMAKNPQLSADKAVELATLKLYRNLKIKPVPVSSVIQISYESENAEQSAQVVNELCMRYVDKHIEINESGSIYEFFRREAQALQDSMEQVKELLAAFSRKTNLIDPPRQREILLQQLAEYEKELEMVRAAKREAVEQVAFLQKQLENEPQIVQMQARRIRETIMKSMQHELDSLKTMYDELTRPDARQTEEEALEKARSVTRTIKSRIAQVEEAMVRERVATPQELASDVNRVMSKLSDDLRQSQFLLIGFQAQEQALSELVVRVKRQLRNIEENSPRYEALKKKYELAQNNYLIYLKKQEEARISEALDRERVANVTIVEPATVPISPLKGNKKMNLALGFLLACFVAIGVPYGLSYFDPRIHTPQEIEKRLDIPVLGMIPEARLMGDFEIVDEYTQDEENPKDTDRRPSP